MDRGSGRDYKHRPDHLSSAPPAEPAIAFTKGGSPVIGLKRVGSRNIDLGGPHSPFGPTGLR